MPLTGTHALYSSTFEKDRLIYNPAEATWHRPSECLWTDTTHIDEKIAIASHYPDLRDLFVDFLSVQEPDLAMYVRQLLLLVSNKSPDMPKIKSLIFVLNTFARNADLGKLASEAIIPVMNADGTVSLAKSTSIFALPDRAEYSRMFEGKVATIDFGIEELHTLSPFVSAMGMGSKLMSSAVRETNSNEEATLDEKLTTDFRQRAFALFR